VIDVVGRRIGRSLPAVPPFGSWRAPVWPLWPFVGALIVWLWSPPALWLRDAAVDVAVAASVLYGVGGLALSYRLLRERLAGDRLQAALALGAGFLLLAVAGLAPLFVILGVAGSVLGGRGMPGRPRLSQNK